MTNKKDVKTFIDRLNKLAILGMIGFGVPLVLVLLFYLLLWLFNA